MSHWLKAKIYNTLNLNLGHLQLFLGITRHQLSGCRSDNPVDSPEGFDCGNMA